jgi:xanthine/uracil permease
MSALWTRLRFASPGAIGLSAVMALVAAVVLARTDPPASFLIGVLFGLAVGLAAFAFAVRLRRIGGL